MTQLADKRVAIIGTGATAVQCVPHLARDSGALYVFQRTPSSVDVRANAADRSRLVREHRHAGLAAALARELHRQPGRRHCAGRPGAGRLDRPGAPHPRAGHAPAARADDAARTCWPRSRTPTTKRWRRSAPASTRSSKIRDTAQKLKAWYRQLCKRPCFHDEYLQAFNSPNTTLVDTDGKGVERITERGVVVAGVEYPVDCIIYASGFEVGTEYKRRAGFDLTGRGGLKLSDYWARGHAHQARHPRARFSERVHRAADPRREPDLQRAAQPHRGRQDDRRDRAPRARRVRARGRGHEGGRGRVGRAAAQRPRHADRFAPTARRATTTTKGRIPGSRGELNVGYPAGAQAYFRYLDEWRRSGRFEGLEFRGA